MAAISPNRLTAVTLPQDRRQSVPRHKEVGTLVWPNGANFDPATLHDWPQCEAAFLSDGIALGAPARLIRSRPKSLKESQSRSSAACFTKVPAQRNPAWAFPWLRARSRAAKSLASGSGGS